jgi:hypothetical protein
MRHLTNKSAKSLNNEQVRQQLRKIAGEARRLSSAIQANTALTKQAQAALLDASQAALVASQLIGRAQKYAAPEPESRPNPGATGKLIDLIYQTEHMLADWQRALPVAQDYLSDPLTQAIFKLQGSLLRAKNRLDADYYRQRQGGPAKSQKRRAAKDLPFSADQRQGLYRIREQARSGQLTRSALEAMLLRHKKLLTVVDNMRTPADREKAGESIIRDTIREIEWALAHIPFADAGGNRPKGDRWRYVYVYGNRVVVSDRLPPRGIEGPYVPYDMQAEQNDAQLIQMMRKMGYTIVNGNSYHIDTVRRRQAEGQPLWQHKRLAAKGFEGAGEPPKPAPKKYPQYNPHTGSGVSAMDRDAYQDGWYDAYEAADDHGTTRVTPTKKPDWRDFKNKQQAYERGWHDAMRAWESE